MRSVHLQLSWYSFMDEQGSQGKEVDMKAVGRRLREAREHRGWNQKMLAREIGTSASHLSSMEHGRVGTSLRTAMTVAKVLRVSLDYLMGFSNDPRSSDELLQELETRSAELRAIKEAYTEGDFVAIAEVDTSAGAGAVVNDEKVTGHMKFPYRWAPQPRPAAGRMPDHPRHRRLDGTDVAQRGRHPGLPREQGTAGREGLRHPDG